MISHTWYLILSWKSVISGDRLYKSAQLPVSGNRLQSLSSVTISSL